MRPRLSPKWILLPLALFLLWLGGPAVWLLWVGVLVVPLVWKGRWRWRANALWLTPFAFVAGGFLSGVVNYAVGTARIEGSGLPGPEYWNLEPGSRAPARNWGCVVWGPEPVMQLPNDAAVWLLGRVFGPMPGAYRGPYPSLTEVAAAFDAHEEPIDFDALKAGHVKLASTTLELSPSVWTSLTQRRRTVASGHGDEAVEASATLFSPELLLLDLHFRGQGDDVSLVAVDSHQMVATYRFFVAD